MVLTIGKIPEGRSVLSQKVKVEEDRAQWIPLIGELQCRAEIDFLRTRISVHVFYEGKVELECSRCLKKFEHPVKGGCYVLLKNTSADKKRPAAQDEDEGEESDFSFNDKTDEIDIRSAIFDEILLALPLKPLCSETCPGFQLKPNVAIEKKEDKQSDPRWDRLKKINSKSNVSHHASGTGNSK
jgi:uncharacterized protein